MREGAKAREMLSKFVQSIVNAFTHFFRVCVFGGQLSCVPQQVNGNS